jgi:hypothetical protein
MPERSIGITSRAPTDFVAAFTAAEQADGESRLIQIISLTAGKISDTVGAPLRIVSVNDTMDVSTLTGDVIVGDNSYASIYVQHSQPTGSCLVTPLLCDGAGTVIGCLSPKQSQVCLTLQSGTGSYMSSNLNWDVKGSGAIKIFPHVSGISAGDEIKLWVFVI